MATDATKQTALRASRMPLIVKVLAPNSKVLATLSYCPICSKPDMKVRADWSAYPHVSSHTDLQCPGPHPESLLLWLLADADMNTRDPKNLNWHGYDGDADDAWSRSNRAASERVAGEMTRRHELANR
ncbi:hypothetical protein ABIB34_003683 [Rhodococcus sp. UYP5]